MNAEEIDPDYARLTENEDHQRTGIDRRRLLKLAGGATLGALAEMGLAPRGIRGQVRRPQDFLADEMSDFRMR